MKTMFVFAMKRSGQHAIINWICKQSSPAVHFNNCSYEKNRIKINDFMHVYTKDGQVSKQDSCKNINLQDYNLVVLNFEEDPVQDFSTRVNFIKSEEDIYLVVVRDPFNLIASRFRVFNKAKFKSFKRDAYINHVESFGNDSVVTINYNKWCIDKIYREEVSNNLNMYFSDKGRSDVYGAGKSSFNGKSYHGRAQKMDVLNRWRRYKDNEGYVNVFDDELISISEQYFEFNPLKED